MFHENQTVESVSRLVKTLKLNQHRLDNRLGVPPNSIQEFSGEQTLLNGAPTSNETQDQRPPRSARGSNLDELTTPKLRIGPRFAVWLGPWQQMRYSSGSASGFAQAGSLA